MIRWEQLENGDWHGFSGELPVATVAKDPDAEREQWAWKIHGLKRPKGWRKPIGHLNLMDALKQSLAAERGEKAPASAHGHGKASKASSAKKRTPSKTAKKARKAG